MNDHAASERALCRKAEAAGLDLAPADPAMLTALETSGLFDGRTLLEDPSRADAAFAPWRRQFRSRFAGSAAHDDAEMGALPDPFDGEALALLFEAAQFPIVSGRVLE